jgi:hypothetical protein
MFTNGIGVAGMGRKEMYKRIEQLQETLCKYVDKIRVKEPEIAQLKAKLDLYKRQGAI